MQEDKRLERLYDYTKFHIGIYLSAGGALVALLGSDKSSWLVTYFGGSRTLLGLALFFMVLAGFAGGVIASSTTSCRTFEDFWEKKQGPLIFAILRGEYWTYLEHLAFWASIALFGLAVLRGGATSG